MNIEEFMVQWNSHIAIPQCHYKLNPVKELKPGQYMVFSDDVFGEGWIIPLGQVKRIEGHPHKDACILHLSGENEGYSLTPVGPITFFEIR